MDATEKNNQEKSKDRLNHPDRQRWERTNTWDRMVNENIKMKKRIFDENKERCDPGTSVLRTPVVGLEFDLT